MSYILVTGSNGFIARSLIRKLLKQSHKVIGLSTKDEIGGISPNYRHIKLNITNTLELERVFKENSISTVIHLAAIAHLKGRNDINWNEYYRVNTLASKFIFKLAKQYKADVFYASTVDVYGDVKESIIDERSKPNPISEYAKSKYLAEKLLEREFKNSSKYVIARFAPVYASNYMKDIFKRGFIKYPNLSYKIGKGYNYHFASLNNIVDFISSWIKLEHRPVGIYNICDNFPVDIKELLIYEKENNKSITVTIPSILIPILAFIMKTSNIILKNNKIQKIHLNMYKLISPPKYSNEKMKRIYNPRWDLKNTVYGTKEDNNYTE